MRGYQHFLDRNPMKIQTVILAAGQSKRMKSDLPKPLMPLMGKPLLEWILDAISDAGITLAPIVVVGHKAEQIKAAFSERELTFVEQKERLGTGHAVLQAYDAIEKAQPDKVVVLCGDVPLISSELVKVLGEAHPPSVLGFYADDPFGYGRIVTDDNGEFVKIVEEKDASDEEKEITLVNSGIYTFPMEDLKKNLEGLNQNNAQGEYYLTEVAPAYASQGKEIEVLEINDEVQTKGVNDLSQLAELTQEAKYRIVTEHIENGVFFDDPSTVFVEADVTIEQGARIMPFTVIRRGAKIASGCEVGPFAHIREGTVMEQGSAIGNFTEIKKSTLGEGSKAKHLSYIGDAVIGKKVNIGAGTIFANYDGKDKHQTKVGNNTFIGSGTVLVAPVNIGEKAKTGAGAIVTSNRNVDDGVTVVGVPAKPLKPKNKG